MNDNVTDGPDKTGEQAKLGSSGEYKAQRRSGEHAALGPTATDYMLAGFTMTNGELLRKFADSNDPALRIKVAGNIASPQDVLETLAQDPSAAVRSEVAKNPRAPYMVLQELSTDFSPLVRFAMAQSIYTPLPILKKLDKDLEIRVKRRAEKTIANLARLTKHNSA